MYGYLRKYASAAIRVPVEEPDFSELPDQKFDWCETVFGKVEELLPSDAPKPLGKQQQQLITQMKIFSMIYSR
jgi:hypothetical protein